MIQNPEHKPIGLVPNESHLSYQLFAWSPVSNSTEADKKFVAAISETFCWLKKRFRNISQVPKEITPKEDLCLDHLHSFQVDNGYTINVSYIQHDRIWAMKLLEPDMGPRPGAIHNRKPVPGRMFQTNIAYRINRNRLECGFVTYCIQPSDCGEDDWEVFRLRMIELQYLKESKNSGNQLVRLKTELDSLQKIMADLEHKKTGIEKDLILVNRRRNEETNELNKALEKSNAQRKGLEDENKSLKDRMIQLQTQIEYYKSRPQTYKNLPAWIERHYSYVIILTTKAWESIKSGQFEDIALLCDAINCLAEMYPKRIKGLVNEDEFKNTFLELGLEYRADSGRCTKNTYLAYHPEYPEGSGQRIELKMHIRNKTDKSRDYHDHAGVLRIYFSYDKKREKVVIHHLPGHLPIKSS